MDEFRMIGDEPANGRTYGLAAALIVLAMKRGQRFIPDNRSVAGGPIPEPSRFVNGREIYRDDGYKAFRFPLPRVFVYFDELAKADTCATADEIAQNANSIMYGVTSIGHFNSGWMSYNMIGVCWAESDRFAVSLSVFRTPEEAVLFGMYAAALLGQRGLDLAASDEGDEWEDD